MSFPLANDNEIRSFVIDVRQGEALSVAQLLHPDFASYLKSSDMLALYK